MTDEQKKKQDILLALAVLLGGMTEKQISRTSEFKDLTPELQKRALKDFALNRDRLQKLIDDPETTQVEIQQEMAEIGQQRGAKVFKILNPGDERTCQKCREWIGKKVSDEDQNYPSVQDWIDAGGLHYGCRCSLHPVEEIAEIDEKAKDYLERKKKRLEEAAAFFNCEPLNNLVFN